MNMHYHMGIVTVMIFNLIPKLVALRLYGACAPLKPETSTPPTCEASSFPCLTGECIKREYHCDGDSDCSDNSDELYCEGRQKDDCPTSFSRCFGSTKCIPDTWLCDGETDCSSEEDEFACIVGRGSYFLPKNISASANQKAVLWMNKKIYPASETHKWGFLVHKSAVALYLADPSFSENQNSSVRQEMAYELSVQLLSQLAQKSIQGISTSDLASFVNALVVTCVDPRDFHGFNLIQELTIRVNSERYTNPYVLIALCNAGEKITKLDVDKLNDTFWSNNREIWTDTQALVVMALSCARDQPDSSIDSDSEMMMDDLITELKQHQYPNGTVENLQTTALVMQALYAAETTEDLRRFDEIKAVSDIIRNQQPDGSFGSLILTYYALPVLNCKSLINISSSHCPTPYKDEDATLHDLVHRTGVKVRIQYSVWIGMQRDLERTLAIRVSVNTSFHGIMEIAARIDIRYKFEYVVKNQKPYVTAVSGILDDAESGKFWFPYILHDGKPSPLQTSTADVISKDGDHFVMWYRKGLWAD